MRRFFCLLLLCLAASAWSQNTAPPVRGLIIKLRASDSGQRETAQAARDRVAAVAHDSGLSLASQRTVGVGHHLLRLNVPQQGTALDATMRRLRLHPEVLWVEPDVLVKPATAPAIVPNDPGYAFQWHLQSPSSYPGSMNATAAWNTTTGSAAITVAVLDTGILPHADLVGRYWPGYDFVSEVEYANDGDGRDPDPTDPGDWVSQSDISNPATSALFAGCSVANSSWHGTFIAGLIAASTNNAANVAGINWASKILPVRVSGKCGALLSDILDGMVWAAGFSVAGVPANPNPARVINLSFGGSAACSSSYQDVINQVTAAGVLVVVAAGNDSGLAMRPADCANVLAVGAVGQAGTKAYYSDVGPTIGLVAPGGILSSSSSVTTTGMYSTSNTGVTTSVADTLRSEQGTSFSAPMAAGVASLMLSINPGLSPAQLIARMQAGARPHAVNPSLLYCSLSYAQACNCTTSVCGAGLLDANQALSQAGNPAASIAAIATQLPGATISLDGRASTALAGSTITTYAWSQTSGALATLNNPTSALASAVLPAAAGSFVFRLQVTDSLGRSGADTVTVVSAVPVVAASSASAAVGGGGGALGWLWGLGLWLLALAVPRQWPGSRAIRRRAAPSPATGT